MSENTFENSSKIFEKKLTLSDRPCKKCKNKFIIENKNEISKYCNKCFEIKKKYEINNNKIERQFSMRPCINCRKRFTVGKYFSNFCESCNLNREAISQIKKFRTESTTNNTMDEYKNKANIGVRWGREFIYLKNNEPTPILLMQGKYYVINREGQPNCVGNRLPSRSYVIQKYEKLLTSKQLTALHKLISI